MRWRARNKVRIGPYFRHYSATASRDGARAGFASHGFRFRLGPFGTFTYNLTHRTWSWDHKGPGAVSGGGRR